MRESILLRIASEPPARIWSGVGDLIIPPDAIEPSGAVFLGGAALISAPDFQQLMNGQADRLDFTLSGVTAEIIALAMEERESVEGADLDLGTIRFDDAWQPLGPVTWEAQFRCDTLTIGSQAANGGRTRTLTLSVGTDETGRSRAPIALFTDADQRRIAPTDKFFDHVAGITAGTSRRFGPV